VPSTFARLMTDEIADYHFAVQSAEIVAWTGRPHGYAHVGAARDARTTADPGNPDPPVTSVSSPGSRDALMQNYLQHGEVGGM